MFTEHGERLIYHFTSFYDTVKYCSENGTEEEKNLTVHQIAQRYIDGEIKCEQAMKEYYEEEKRIYARNAKILKAVGSVRGQSFYKHLREYVKDLDRVDMPIEIVSKPEGKWQTESGYGRAIKGVWIEQWSTGMEGDSFSGIVCIEVKKSRFLKIHYSC